MATFSQIIRQLASKQQLGTKETGASLGMSAQDSTDLIKELDRKYREAAQDTTSQFSDYSRKGKALDTATTLIGLVNPLAAAGIGFLGKRARKKPKFKLDISKAAPGFEDRLFGKQAGEDLVSAIRGTRKLTSDALKGSLFNDAVGTLTSLFSSYSLGKGLGMIDKDSTFGDFLQRQAKKGTKDKVEDVAVDASLGLLDPDSFNVFRDQNFGLGNRSLYDIDTEGL
tara:strand:+ start:246 stop:923 length:678 start_codon:yes stop_codon:yes gene_type:complete